MKCQVVPFRIITRVSVVKWICLSVKNAEESLHVLISYTVTVTDVALKKTKEILRCSMRATSSRDWELATPILSNIRDAL